MYGYRKNNGVLKYVTRRVSKSSIVGILTTRHHTIDYRGYGTMTNTEIELTLNMWTHMFNNITRDIGRHETHTHHGAV